MHFAGGRQKGPNAKVSPWAPIKHLPRNGPYADGLRKSYPAVGLQGRCSEVLPRNLCHGQAGRPIGQALINTPKYAKHEESGTACCRAGRLLGMGQAAGPVAGGLPAWFNGGGRPLVLNGPAFGVVRMGSAFGKRAGSHITGVAGGIVPEGVAGVGVGLPAMVHLIDNGADGVCGGKLRGALGSFG